MQKIDAFGDELSLQSACTFRSSSNLCGSLPAFSQTRQTTAKGAGGRFFASKAKMGDCP